MRDFDLRQCSSLAPADIFSFFGFVGVNAANRGEMEKPSRVELAERADRAIATAKILMEQFAWAIDQEHPFDRRLA